ncbi:MAG: hypothetical protein WCS77_04295 [Elusimicrobiaceae bacterium]
MKRLLILCFLFSAPVPGFCAMRDCDTSALAPDNAVKTVKDSSGKAWTIFKREGGSSLCVYANRYILFSEDLSAFVGVDDKDGELIAHFKNDGTESYYHIPARKLESEIEEYRGEGAGVLFTYKTVSPAGDSRAGLISINCEKDFKKYFGAALGDYAKTNWFWANPKVREKVTAAVAKETDAMTADEVAACAPTADIRLSVARIYLIRYLEALATKDKAKIETFSKPAVTINCTAPGARGGKDNVILTMADLLDTFHR